MTVKKIVYGSWEDDPALLVTTDRGLYGYVYIRGEWVEGYVGDISMKANDVGEAGFKDLFPDVKLPALS
jgi:hypothetical protein